MKAFIALLGLGIYFFSPHISEGWVLVKEQDGIRMYNRPSAHSKFNDLKIEADFTGTIRRITDILCDVEKYTEWASNTKTSTMIKKISPTEFIYYSVFDAPWPANDRDYYAYCKIFFDSASHTMKVVSSSINNYRPEKKNVVRIPLSNAVWNITATSDKKIHLEYILELDPGGSVPPWLLNLISINAPMETFENLKKRLAN